MLSVIVAAVVLGLIVGLGVNALADTLPSLRRPGAPRCQACGAPRPLRAWNGMLALLLRNGSCSYCGQSIGVRVALVELSSTAGILWLSLRFPQPAAFWTGILIFATFLLIAVIDIEHHLILHIVTGPAAIAIGLVQSMDPTRGAQKTLLGGLAGFGLVLGLYALGGVFARIVARMRGQDLDEIAFGFGDVTLSGIIGLTVGWPGVIAAILLGVLLAGFFSTGYLLIMLLRRRYVAFTAIPYGPFLILGGSLVYFGGRDLFTALLL